MRRNYFSALNGVNDRLKDNMIRHKRGSVMNQPTVFNAFVQSQYSGVGYKRIGQLPYHVLEDTEYTDGSGLVEMIPELDMLSCKIEHDDDVVLMNLKGILGSLMNFEPRRTQDDASQGDEQDRFAAAFYELGGVDVLLRILMFNTLFPVNMYRIKPVGYQESELMLRTKSLIIEILTKLVTTSTGDNVTAKLMANDDVLNYVFTLLAHQKTFINACQLIEDMIQMKREVLDLHRITNIKSLICILSDVQLANFCRILAVAISDLDIYENKSSLFAQNKQKRSKGFVNVRDINQELLLGIPDLLPRLVNLAVAKEYTPRYRGKCSELDCWMEWIENQMAEEMYESSCVDDLDDFIGARGFVETLGLTGERVCKNHKHLIMIITAEDVERISEPTVACGPMNVQQGLKITEELVQRVEVVYVLGLFLLGKHRKKVQRKLAELKLAPGLCELFDQFIWKCQVSRHNSRHRLRGHNAACECSPEVALKIQFLRLVHSFCDHSDYKHLLLSKNELTEVKRINANAGSLALTNLDVVNRQLMCRGSKGLLTKIVEVMKKEPTTSTFRFWLARAVESYLRGNTSYCDQIFLMRRGLLQHVASNIVEHEIRNKEILQSSFDLLGELIKFNMEAFKTFEEILNTQAKFDKFINAVNKNLVDSNMFIRSMVLSLEHATTQDSATVSSGKDLDILRKDNKLLTYIGDFNQQLEYLYKLIKIINVDNLTQENVSCLNTTLVFLMFANRKNQLPRYLQALRDEKEDMWEVSGSGNLLRNFRDLLTFWQDHYLHKDKDCSALEKSSRISFEYWKQTVSMLVSDDKEEKSGILHYVTPLPSERPN